MAKRHKKKAAKSASETRSGKLAVAVATKEREPDYWIREFDALHARMQTRKALQAVDAIFSASDAELNRSDT